MPAGVLTTPGRIAGWPAIGPGSWPAAWRTAYVGFALLMSVNAFYWMFGAGADKTMRVAVSSNKDNPVYVGLWLVLYAVSVALVARSAWRRGIGVRVLAILPFAAYVIGSASWAEERSTVAVKATMLVFNIVIAEALASTVSPARFLRIMARLNLGLLLISFVLLAIDPAAVISDPARPGLLMSGEFFGAFGGKLVLGQMSFFAVLIIVFLPGTIEGRWARGLALLALGTGIILSNSMSSLSGGLVALALLGAARLWPRWAKPMFVVVSCGAVLWALLAPVIDVGALASVIGRTANLTGRGEFWPWAPAFILQHPYFGYGYTDFFNIGAYSPGWQVWDRERYFITPEFHNTIIDVTIGLGLVGAAAFLLILGATLAVFMHRTLDRACAELLAALLIFITIGSATEFVFLTHNTIATIMLFYCFFVGGRRYGVGQHAIDHGPPQAPVAALPLAAPSPMPTSTGC